MVESPEAQRRIEEGAQQHGHRLEELERNEDNARHVRELGGRDRRWMWMVLALVVALVVLFVLYHLTGASDATPPTP